MIFWRPVQEKFSVLNRSAVQKKVADPWYRLLRFLLILKRFSVAQWHLQDCCCCFFLSAVVLLLPPGAQASDWQVLCCALSFGRQSQRVFVASCCSSFIATLNDARVRAVVYTGKSLIDNSSDRQNSKPIVALAHLVPHIHSQMSARGARKSCLHYFL